MKDTEIADLLRARNPWWRDSQHWQSADEDLREAAEAPFEYRPEALQDIAPGGLYTLSGPRRIGKSLELRRTVARLIAGGMSARNIIYCSCDGFSSQDLRRLFRVAESLIRQSEGQRWWLIDEITAVRGWSSIVKDLRDNTRLRRDCLVLTGSSSRELREARKHLAGRRGPATRDADRLLLPIPFRDFGQLVGGLSDVPGLSRLLPREMMSPDAREAIGELSFWSNQLVDAWELYLRIGGFPRAIRDFVQTGDVTKAFTRDLWDVARGEAVRVSSLNDAQLLSLLAHIARALCNPINASKIAVEAGLGNHHSVGDRVNDLTFAFLLWICHRIDDNGAPNTRAQRKVYFVDPAIALIPSVTNSAYAPPDVSQLSEQQIGLSLARAASAGDANAFLEANDVLFERTATSEIDFVGSSIEVPVESKYVERNWKSQSRALSARYGRGIVATRNVLDLDGATWAIPAAIVAWLLGS
jgi:predicted AAA+ superfamily ATPase